MSLIKEAKSLILNFEETLRADVSSVLPDLRQQLHAQQRLAAECKAIRKRVQIQGCVRTLQKQVVEMEQKIQPEGRVQKQLGEFKLALKTLASEKQALLLMEDFRTTLSRVCGPPILLGQEECMFCEGQQLRRVIAESMLVCLNCGETIPYLDTTVNPVTCNEDNIDVTTYQYKKETHFATWLVHLQGRENTEVPATIINSVMQKLYEDRVKDVRFIQWVTVRKALESLKLSKYYKHVTQIYVKITNNARPHLSPQIEVLLNQQFSAVLNAFQTNKGERSNMISYPFIIYKLFELNGCHEFCKFLSLLKGNDKIAKTDMLWKEICEKIGLQFIPTIR